MVIIASGALTVAVCAMLWNCIQDCRFLHSYRLGLRERINDLRIHRMLESLGVSRNRYMRKALITEVETHLHRCQQCPNIPECDAALEKADTSSGDAFCPNYRELAKFVPRRGGREDGS